MPGLLLAFVAKFIIAPIAESMIGEWVKKQFKKVRKKNK